ncbi:MAG TPA: potassium transporter TrkA [Gammaproteobacteria bacterium]|nr:potassium transporter TrkA [Gammaproteobacteria bacterium]
MPNIVYVLFRRLRLPLIVLISVYAASILGFVLIPGVDDTGHVWHMGFFHAFYFVSFMGSTIGFGEIPYAFTDPQRMWTTVCIYATVIAWLFGIGSLLNTMQDPAFRKLMVDSTFNRKIRNLTEPFYLICGYGDTGKLLASALALEGIRSVIIDQSQDNINSLELSDFGFKGLGYCADSSRPQTLLDAGLKHPNCRGVVALTNDEQVNLKIALTSHLLTRDSNKKRGLPTMVRAEHEVAARNIASFGNNQVIDPFETFAGRLAMAFHSPGMYLLYEWMTGVPYETLHNPLFPPRGKWILCSYGRFGRAVYERLINEGIIPVVVEANIEVADALEKVIKGDGTEASTLLEAGIKGAVGIVAGTDNDANNLSILMTARELNPKLFTIARQNRRRNDLLFEEAEIDMVMQRGSVIAHKIFALIRNPLVGNFLNRAKQHDNEWANQLISRISGVVHNHVPLIWEIDITPNEMPAFYRATESETNPLTIGHAYRDPRNRLDLLPCVPLLVRRGYEDILLPPDDFKLESRDKLLFCGRNIAHKQMEWNGRNYNVLLYVITGEEHPSGILWKALNRRRKLQETPTT